MAKPMERQVGQTVLLDDTSEVLGYLVGDEWWAIRVSEDVSGVFPYWAIFKAFQILTAPDAVQKVDGFGSQVQ